jgi:hypothetical protein
MIAGALETVGAALAGRPLGGAGRWVVDNARWLRILAGLLGAVVLLWGNDVSPSRLLWSLMLVVVPLVIVQVLVGAGATRAASKAPVANTDDRQHAVVQPQPPPGAGA